MKYSRSICSYWDEQTHSVCLQRGGKVIFLAFLYLLHHNMGKKYWVSQIENRPKSQRDFKPGLSDRNPVFSSTITSCKHQGKNKKQREHWESLRIFTVTRSAQQEDVNCTAT